MTSVHEAASTFTGMPTYAKPYVHCATVECCRTHPCEARECLDRILIFNRRQLERVLRVYVGHYNQQRPHRALALQPPDQPTAPSTRGELPRSAAAIRRRDLLGGLIHQYQAAAA